MLQDQIEKEQETLFRHIYCYGTLTFSMLIGIITRTLYIEINEDVFEESGDSKKQTKIIDFRFSFMEITLINHWCFIWSLLVMLLIWWLVFYGSEYQNKQYSRNVMAKWILSVSVFYLFMFVYEAWKRWFDHENFEPSGHIIVNLVGQANHLCYFMYVGRKDTDQISVDL